MSALSYGRCFLRALRVVLRAGALVALGLALLIFLFQEKMIYHPRAYAEGEVERLAGARVREIPYAVDGVEGLAFYLPPSVGGEPSKVWLVCGGNAARALGYAPLTQDWDERWGYLFVDYPGYGASAGKPSPRAIDAAVDAAIAVWRDECEAPLSAFGHSIGGAVVLRAAVRHEMKEIVLVSPFTSMMAMARHAVGWPLCELLRHRFDNVEALRSLAARPVKVVVFHGVQDAQVPVQMSRDLAAQFPDLIRYHELRYADHNGIVSNYAHKIGAAMSAVER